VVKEGSPRGEGTIDLTKPQCRINPEKRPLPLPFLSSSSSNVIGRLGSMECRRENEVGKLERSKVLGRLNA
jgi:hypothetical protein